MTAEATTTPTHLCSKCGQAGEFRKGHRQCRGCESRAAKRWQQEHADWRPRYKEANREKNLVAGRERNRRVRAERHLQIDHLKSAPCVDCGRRFPPFVMDFDHRDPSTKKWDISGKACHVGYSWQEVLFEIEKCDLVCGCCHRLRTWTPPKSMITRQRLLITLKGDTCMDCGGGFKSCQLEFDHVRGVKLGCVPNMGSIEAIRDEALKCDVVCTNCHRIRTHVRADARVKSRTPMTEIDMGWTRRGRNPRSTFVAEKPRLLVVPDWHALVGTMTDKELALQVGLARPSVTQVRNAKNIPPFKPLAPWHILVGTMPDGRLAARVGVSRGNIVKHRARYGLPKFNGVENG